ACALEGLAEVRIGLDERPRNPVPDRAGLAARTAAVDAHANVEGPFDAGHLQRRQRQLAVREAREVLLDRLAVEPGRAVTRAQDHTRDRGLALAGSLVLGGLGGSHHLTSSGCGAWASCGCSGPAYTFSLVSCCRARRLRGSIPLTALRITSVGRRSSSSRSGRLRRPPG